MPPPQHRPEFGDLNSVSVGTIILGIDEPGPKQLVRMIVTLVGGRQLDLLDQAVAKMPGKDAHFLVRYPQADTFGTCP